MISQVSESRSPEKAADSSYYRFRHPDGRTVTVPDHRGEDLGRGILAKILRDAETAPQVFLDWLTR